jgi:GntR family transcriptional repressor for pyruvate dehydrogenase complex
MALVDDAVAQLRELIRSGGVPAGSRLPAEAQLAAQLGVSRNTTREAVKILAAARLLDVRQGDGTYVTSLSPDVLLEGFGFAVDLLQDHHLMDVIGVRRMLEPQATAAAATRMSSEELGALAGLLALMAESADRQEVMIEYDLAFHRGIVAAAGNALLTSMLDALSSQTSRARIWRGIIEEGSAAQTIAEHEAIYAALRQGDPALAYSAALMHINTSEQWLRQFYPGTQAGRGAEGGE